MITYMEGIFSYDSIFHLEDTMRSLDIAKIVSPYQSYFVMLVTNGDETTCIRNAQSSRIISA